MGIGPHVGLLMEADGHRPLGRRSDVELEAPDVNAPRRPVLVLDVPGGVGRDSGGAVCVFMPRTAGGRTAADNAIACPSTQAAALVAAWTN